MPHWGGGRDSRRPVVLSLGSLSKALGISKYRTKNFLTGNGIPIHRTGVECKQRKQIVLWSEVEKHFPALADATRFRLDDDE